MNNPPNAVQCNCGSGFKCKLRAEGASAEIAVDFSVVAEILVQENGGIAPDDNASVCMRELHTASFGKFPAIWRAQDGKNH